MSRQYPIWFFFVVLSLSFLCIPLVRAGDSTVTFCPAIVLSHSVKPEFSDVEKRLICGDPDHPANEAWRTIPLAQAQLQIKVSLQSRGYLHPTFKPNREETSCFVELGEPTRATSIRVDGEPESFHIERKRKILGELLTPGLLGNLEKWTTETLQATGYGCPKVATEANPDTGQISLHITTGPLQNLVSVTDEPVSGLEPRVLRRYDAFQLDELYDRDLLVVTEDRVMTDKLLQSTHFSVTCDGEGVHAHQSVVPGQPRLLTAGIGLDTEEVLIGRASWQTIRLGRLGSSIKVSLRASFRKQTLEGAAQWYVLPYPSRFFLRPLIEIKHDNEPSFEMISERAQLIPTTTWDNHDIGFTFSSGPTLDVIHTLRGAGISDSHFLSLESRVEAKTHDFEFNHSSPRSGVNASLLTNWTHADLFSQVSAQRFRLQIEGLWNLNQYDPPLLVIGARGGLATIITADRPGPSSSLPPSYLEYLGGSADLRGFNRQELNANGYGGLSSAFVDFEVRLANVAPLGLEPFVFSDLGALGSAPFILDSPFYWSPGAGIRWASPIGVFRTTFAQGFTAGQPAHFQFYISFGEEF
jgi:translocation and assembly module TamA